MLGSNRLDLEPPSGALHGERFHAALLESWAELGAWLHWASGDPPSEAAARARLDEAGPRTFVMVDRASGELVGRIGLYQFDESVPKCALGFWVRSGTTGRGYATEAARRLLEHAFHDLGCERVELRCDSKNTRSAGVARRLGMTLDGVMRSDWRNVRGELNDSEVWSLLRAEHSSSSESQR